MPRFTITGEQRDALRGQVCNHLGALTDVLIALEHDNFAAAERLGRQFAEDFRLLEDIGWQPDIDRPACLTMSSERLVVRWGVRGDGRAQRRSNLISGSYEKCSWPTD